ncbi:Glycerophosphoryl diester phosphodiesterase [Corchorus olitorius]|uniref:glycerophosphodiester phosphodiesterase n=1 Tax=Corchorus olitorius TaxID=93759 RepID=A0A1R3HNL0_9ROSI|nr:Glycerophosphoryl diester phosphodiesterase [Corchorus olitorius]
MSSTESQPSTRSEGEEEEEEQGLELNLGLSLGGRFGVDKNAKKLTRSSSIAGSIPIFREDIDANTPPAVSNYPTLIRTSSLPTETEEEWRKRKELQTLRRMEAKRRRSEKQRSSREKMEVNLLEEEKQTGRNSIPPFGLHSWAAAARQVILGGGSEVLGMKGKGGGSAAGFSQPFMQPCSQGSVESQGGSSSSMSEMENKALQDEHPSMLWTQKAAFGFDHKSSEAGSIPVPLDMLQLTWGRTILASPGFSRSKGGHSTHPDPPPTRTAVSCSYDLFIAGASSCGEARSTGSTQSLQDQGNKEAMGSSGTKKSETSRTSRLEAETLCKTVENKGKEKGNVLEDMPCVFTKGEGPNGKRIEGILYRYGKGEEVRIMCVCHGNFLSPAEFVKHAGGGDVDHPLRHIVVNPSSASLFQQRSTLGLLGEQGTMSPFGECAARPIYPLPSKAADRHVEPLQTTRPYNIAHRGANGELPEETAAAYKRAIEEGADFIETDILASKDGVLICFHDLILDNTTDIANHKQFADRKRSYDVQGVNVTGWFLVDFTLEELKLLRVNQRFGFRDQQYNGKFPLITFEEFISLALDAKRVIGIHPEIKNPVFINQHVKWSDGKKFEDKFVETLQKYGYKGSYMSKEWLRKPVFIQSFAPTSLIYVSNLTKLPKILLIADPTIRTEDTNQTFSEITSDNYFKFIKKYVVGIGPWKETIVPSTNNYINEATDLVSRAHAHGLQVHPYTFRNENMFLHFNFSQDPYEEYYYWINKIKVDGFFTDFTGSLRNFQEWTSHLSH